MKWTSKKGKGILFLLLPAMALAVLIPKSRTVYGILDGDAYHMVATSEEAVAPWIWFDVSGTTVRFTSSLDKRISLVTSGTVVFQSGKVYAISDDETQTWIFEVIDNDTIAFISHGSTIPTDSKGNEILCDGALFKRID